MWNRDAEGGREIAKAFGLNPSESLSQAIADLMRELGLPATLGEMGYSSKNVDALAEAAHRSHFNRSTRYHPTVSEYAAMINASLTSR